MYRDDQRVSLSFRHMSVHPLFRDDFEFIGIKDPILSQFNGLSEAMLPCIGLIPRIDSEFEEGEIKQSNIDANQPYLAVLNWLAQKTNKFEKLQEMLD